MKTLYVTDLDGTLLPPDKKLTKRTVDILNDRIARGLLFSVNTARSVMGIEILNLGQIRFTLPLILMNGALLYDLGASKVVDARLMEPAVLAAVLDLCESQGKAPMIYRVEGDLVTVTFTDLTNPLEREFLKERRKARPDWYRQTAEYDRTLPGLYFSMQDTYEKLRRIGDGLDRIPAVSYVLYEDNYHKDNWYLEIFSAEGGKDNGMRRLQQRTGAEKTVAIGDNFNDLPMLKAADIGLVVRNGQEAVKAVADRVIGSNEEDGVALYIEEEWPIKE